jgi:nucleotide-binding universal stress UspA family protein
MTPDIKKILYATDLSANSIYALRHALHSAKRYNYIIPLPKGEIDVTIQEKDGA